MIEQVKRHRLVRDLLRALIISAVILACGVGAKAQQPAPRSSLSGLASLLQEAGENNPEIAAAARRLEAARAMIPQARTLPDPMLGFSYEDMDRRETMYGVSQQIPFPGKLRLKGDIAERDAERAEEDYYAVRLSIMARVKEAYHDLQLARESTAIIEKNQELLEQFSSAAEAGYAVGKMAQADVFRAQAEISRSMARLATIRQEDQSANAQLARLLNRPPSAVIEVHAAPAPVPVRYGVEDLVALLDDTPLLRAHAKVVERSNAELDLARREYMPDFEIGVRGMHDEPMGEDGYQLMLNVTVPLYFASKQRYGVRQAIATRAESTQDLQAIRQELVMRVRDEFAKTQRAATLVQLLEGAIVPQAELALAASQSGYAVGRVDFLTLLNSLLTLQESEIELRAEIAAHEKARARLEEIVGVEP